MKVICIVAAILLLTGCTAPKDFETMSDVYEMPQQQAQAVSVSLPAEQAVMAMTDTEGNTLYLCDGYSIAVETFAGGDLDRTLKQVSGFGKEQLQLMERQRDDLRCIECVWTCAGEGEDQIGRSVILDDGQFHYVLTFMADASVAGELTDHWQKIAGSFNLDIGQ